MSQWNEEEARQVLVRLITGYLNDGVELHAFASRYCEVFEMECPLDFPGDEDQVFEEIHELVSVYSTIPSDQDWAAVLRTHPEALLRAQLQQLARDRTSA